MNTKIILNLIFSLALFASIGIRDVNADLTVTCYNECRPVYNNYDEGCINLDLQCNNSSPASFTGQLTVNGVVGSVQIKTCLPINGSCGTASNVETTTKPTTNLCSSGTAGAVSGTGPWTWRCVGERGGATVSCSTLGDRGCVSRDGESVPNGESRNYYTRPTVACGGSCVTQRFVCIDGLFNLCINNSCRTPVNSRSLFSSCSVLTCPTPTPTPIPTPTPTPIPPPSQCVGPDGVVIPNGGSRMYYANSSVSCGQSCSPQTRTCNNGVLSGTASNRNCSVVACSSCTGPDGSVITNGENKRYYERSSVACGGNCDSASYVSSEARVCNNGTLSGRYTNPSCSVSTCASCVAPDGSTIASGRGITTYTSSSVACGQSCGSVAQTRTCNNGTLSGTATNLSCSVASCSCVGPDGVEITNGNSRIYYGGSSVSCGQSCGSVAQTRVCNNGVLSGTASNRNCSVDACASCVAPGGGNIAHGSSITAYTSSSVACGQTCTSQTRTCNNGVLSGNASNLSCSVASCSCVGPDGTNIPNRGSGTYYTSSSVACGQTCTSQTRTCNNGVLSGTATNLSCSVALCPDYNLVKGNNMYLNISPAGARSSRTITTISVVDGFSGDITFSASSPELPQGTVYTFTPSTVSSSGYSSGSSLIVYVPTIIPARVYTVTITGRSGSIVKTVDVLMNVIVDVPEGGEF